MWKVIWTTFIRLVLVVVFWFYLKFIDSNLAGQVSGWLMNQEQVAMSGEVQDPVLSGLAGLETKIDLMSGLNIQLSENNKMLRQISEKLGIVGETNNIATGANVAAPAETAVSPTETNVATGTRK